MPFSAASLLLLTLLSSANGGEWRDYRCIVLTKVNAAGIHSQTLTVLCALRRENGIWYRIQQIDPAEKSFVSVVRGGLRFTHFPSQGLTLRARDADTAGIDGWMRLLESGALAAGKDSFQKSLRLSKLGLPGTADSCLWIRAANRDQTVDSLLLYDGHGTPAGSLTLVTSALKVGATSFPMPARISYASLNGQIKVEAGYSAYRINEGVPEQTFFLDNEK